MNSLPLSLHVILSSNLGTAVPTILAQPGLQFSQLQILKLANAIFRTKWKMPETQRATMATGKDLPMVVTN
ncbi:hypothetical protein EAF04_004971 [Stromatinia cepivora]|nr:hypothetical protein EAF04_004971 [Stromatinia cepivora]